MTCREEGKSRLQWKLEKQKRREGLLKEEQVKKAGGQNVQEAVDEGG